MSDREIAKLYEGVYRIIFEAQQRRLADEDTESSEKNPFTFFAGSSLRADSGCGDPVCRARRIDFLGRYAALYANEVTMPVPLVAPQKLGDVKEAKSRLSRSASAILQLRPVITRGIIKPVVMVTRHCVRTMEWMRQIDALVYAVAGGAATSSETSRHKTPRPRAQVLHRVIHTFHNAPVDITVDKGTPPDSEKAQQNQHFKYHRPVPSLHCAANKALITKVVANSPASSPSTLIVTLVWNMHRSGAACSLNVTSIGICLSRQHVHIYRNRAFFVAECAAAVDSPGMGDYSETTFGMLAAHEPGVFPGTS
jgi:hypothetical protein